MNLMQLWMTHRPLWAPPNEGASGGEADYSFLVEISTSEEFDLFSIDGFSPPESMPGAGNISASPQTNYVFYLLLGGYVLVALVGYLLGTRERVFRKSTSDETPFEGTVK